MFNAFDLLFKKGFERVVIIGSDCPGLSSKHINNAFAELNNVDVVIGPAKDGGYYLLGMKKLHSAIFNGKNWSTDAVFKETIKSIDELQLTFSKLETLTDVDEEKDIPPEWL